MINNLTLQDNLYSQLLVMRSDLSKVRDASGGYAWMSILSDQLSGGQSESMFVDKYETAYLGSGYVLCPIKGTPTIDGNDLVVTLNNPSYDNFRVDDLVMAGELAVHGLVVASEPGKIKVRSMDGVALTVLQSAFVDGQMLKAFGTISQNRGSSGRSSLVEVPQTEFNYSSVVRESMSLARRDEIDSFIKYQGKFWYHAQQPRAVNRFMRNRERMLWYNQRGQFTGANGQKHDSFGGIDWAIKSSEVVRGNYVPLSAGPTEKTFERFMADTFTTKASSEHSSIMMIGRGMLSWIQNNFTKDFIKYAGDKNTFGGKDVTGLDVKVYRVAGMEVNFKILEHVDDREFYPEETGIPGLDYRLRQYDTYILDLNPTPIVGGGTVPAIRQVHRGKSRYYETFVAGIDSSPSGGPSDDYVKAMANKAIYRATDIDQSSYHILSDMSYTFNAKFSGKMEVVPA